MFGRRTRIVAGVAFALAVAASPVSAGSPESVFTGLWTSIDGDGSTQVLSVSGGSTPRVVYQDYYASGCDTYAGPATHWTAAGSGDVDGDVLWVSFHKSGCGTFLMGGYEDVYFYDDGTDTLSDLWGITWYRQ